jgi:hypothetical protein
MTNDTMTNETMTNDGGPMASHGVHGLLIGHYSMVIGHSP